VIPESGETIRTDDGLRVWRTHHGGAHGTPIAEGLPRIQSVEVSVVS
jgi:hypothetical protein